MRQEDRMDIRNRFLVVVVLTIVSTRMFALPQMVETNDLPNICAKCAWRGCAVRENTMLKPVFFGRKGGCLEFEIAVALAISGLKIAR